MVLMYKVSSRKDWTVFAKIGKLINLLIKPPKKLGDTLKPKES
jgi:hypothetical protein